MLAKTYRPLAWVSAIAFFMQALDATILNTALPKIAQDLSEQPLSMQLAVISYALTVALFIPLSGWLGDKMGTLTLFRIAVGLFVAGSVACALSPSLNYLIASRILQGIGGALMLPVSRLAIIRTVPKNQLLPIWNLMSMTGLIGPILGPMLGGWLVTYASWHWIFLINVPIGLMGILFASKAMPNVFGQSQPFDWLGFILFAGGLVGLTLGLDLSSEKSIAPTQLAIIFSAGIGFFIAYFFHAKKRENALIPLDLFQIRTFSIGIISNLFIRLMASGIPFLLPLMLQLVMHYPADQAGVMVAPIALASMLIKPVISPLLKRFGYKRSLIAISFILAITISAMGWLNTSSPIWHYVILLAIYGACLSIIFTSISTLTVGELDQQLASAGSTMLSVIQQFGIGLGIAVASASLNFYHQSLSQPLEQAFSYTYMSLTAVAILSIFTLSKLKRKDGENLH